MVEEEEGNERAQEKERVPRSYRICHEVESFEEGRVCVVGHPGTQENMWRTAALIVLMLCCGFGTPITLICTLPAYLFADKVCMYILY